MLNKRNSTLIIALLLCSFLAPEVSLRADEDEDNQQSETYEREVDQAALSAQADAIQSLKGLVKQYRGTSKEPSLLLKLAELSQQSASMEFRVGYGAPGKTNSKDNQRLMKESIIPLTRLIEKFSNHPEIARIWFMRGRAHEAINNISAAKRDYLHVVGHFKKSPESIPSYMSLGDFAAKENKHKQAIDYYKNIEKSPNSLYYPHALYKMAWEFHLSKQTASALVTDEKLVKYYNGRKLNGADKALRMNALEDSTIFYFSGFEAQPKKYSTENAYLYFRSLNSGVELGGMLVKYTNLLRAHDHESDLNSWQKVVVKRELKRPETLELLLSIYEYQLNKKMYSSLVLTADHIARFGEENTQLKKSENFEKSQKLVLQTITQLQKRMVSYDGSDKSNLAGKQVAAVSESFVRMVEKNDPRLRSIRANLAETQFAVRQYDKAAMNYRWIVGQGSWSESNKTSKDKTGGITVPQASIKAISSRYEALRERDAVPEELKAISTQKQTSKPMDPKVAEWIQWIDQHLDETDDSIDNFQFEANRTLYYRRHISQSIERLTRFALKYPTSKFAIPSATLVLDTYIESKDWENVEKMALKFASVDEWEKDPFSQKLNKIAANAKYKQAETAVAKKDYDKAIDEAVEFTKQYKSNSLRVDAFAIASNAAISLRDRDQSIEHLNALVEAAPRTQPAAKATLAMAKLEEERYHFSEAAGYYESYLAMPASATKETSVSQKEGLRHRALLLASIGGSTDQLYRLLGKREYCRGYQAECERLRVFSYLLSKDVSEKISRQAVKNSKSSKPEFRSVWAAIALKDPSQLSSSARAQMIGQLTRYWSELNPKVRFLLFTQISDSIQDVFKMERKHISQSVPIKGSLRSVERALIRRMQLVKSYEDLATSASSLPWFKIRADVLKETAEVYAELIEGLHEIPAPDKATDQQEAQHEQMIAEVAAPFVAKEKQIRKEISKIEAQNQTSLSISVLSDIDAQGEWGSVNDNKANAAELIRSKWTNAIKDEKWNQVAFFMNEADATRLIPSHVSAVAKAVSLAAAGAKAEANLALSDLCANRPIRNKIRPACDARGDVFLSRR